MKRSIFEQFPVSNEEYIKLEKEFGKLCYCVMHQLWNKNSRNNHTEDKEDINQYLRMAMLESACYYKRQIFINNCFKAAKTWVKDEFVRIIIGKLEDLWRNRTRHGANRQKFGYYQEIILERIVGKMVPKKFRPDKSAALVIDSDFPRYCKKTIWNKQKNMGKRITREKTIRSGLASISEHDFLASEI